MSHSRSDALVGRALRLCAAGVGAIVVLIFVFLLVESLPAFREVGFTRFLSDSTWYPAAGADGTFGLGAMICGTLAATLGAVLIATPLGIASALFCHFYAPAPLSFGYRRVVELLAGIPSVVYGFWGLTVLVPVIQRIAPPGPSLLAGILILAIMILPTVALCADAALAGVPREQLRGAAALGLSRVTTILGVVLPAARSGLLTGVLLGTGRAIGETMAILMVSGNVVQMPHGLFDPIRTLAANIALEMAYAQGSHRSALFVSGVVLVALVALLVLAAETIARRRADG